MNKTATIGTFDGVHRGHRFLLDQVIRLARADGGRSVVVTFSNSPRSVIEPTFVPSYLTTNSEKRRLLFDFGIDDVTIKPFTTDLMQLSARQFMQQVLHDELGITTLVIGYDHRFGYNRAEGFNDYVRYGKEMGIKVVLANEYQFDGKEVSSSAIRQAVSSGNISMANDLLGYHYSIEGQVINGFHIGRTIGYPTANIQLPNNKLVPADGVYAVTVMLDREEYNGMLNIGHRPTFDNGQRSIEVHLLDFNRDIYSERIQLRFAERIREEKRFESIEELKAQISKDEHQIRMILRQR
ncbi:MAG: bifunctional riboflavin kinase/FAD synthetase [Bacteroidaceae bacterium]|nr:bifunctional riboflavin kinase/FAD synthetase [Bacteroidaceae bacterium]